MKMRHWAYVGLALIAANALLLARLPAAELKQNPFIYREPAFTFWRFRMEMPWRKPVVLTAPVTIRLFSENKLTSVWLRNTSGFVFSGQAVESPLLIEIKDGVLNVYHNEVCELTGPQLRATAMDDKAFEMRTRQGSNHRWTRGEIQIRIRDGRLEIVNKLGLEDYVSGILEGELGSLVLNPEVLKAQLVVARSYVLSMRGNRGHNDSYEFCDSPHCQVFSGVPHKNNPALKAALTSVRGEYLSYKGQPIPAFYHHDCGGMTSAVEDVWPTTTPQPYLVPVSEGARSDCRYSPKYAWRFGEGRRSLAACFRRAHWLHREEALDSIRIVRVDRSGRAQTVMVQGNRTLLIPIGKFRNAVNQYFGREVLRSAMFTVTQKGDRFTFRGRGWGHGVGLCQEGAKAMARQGKTYREILAHYFPHTKLAKLR